MGTGSLPGVKRPGRGADHPAPSKCRGHERVELYLYSPSGPSWPVIGRTNIFDCDIQVSNESCKSCGLLRRVDLWIVTFEDNIVSLSAACSFLRNNSSWGCVTLKVVSLHSSKQSVIVYQSTRHNIAEGLNLQQHRCENLKSLKLLVSVGCVCFYASLLAYLLHGAESFLRS